MKNILFLAVFVLLSACGTGSSPVVVTDPLLPLPAPVKEPDEAAMRAAVRDFLRARDAPPSSVYQFFREDLNGDRRREALVLFNNPYGYWCDFYGCTLLVLQAHEDHFSVVNTIRRVRGGLYVSEKTTHGWKDLIVRVSGRWSETKDVMLEFDGRYYPSDPEKLPPVRVVNPAAGKRLFYD